MSHIIIGQPALPAYPFDQNEFNIPISIKFSDSKTLTITHKLARPTLADLLERESQSMTEMEEVAPNEDAFHTDAEGANAKLWDKVAKQVQGYKAAGVSKDDWADVTPELAAKIPSGHKNAAISGIYAARCVVERDSDDGFNLDGESYIIRQEIGTGDEPSYVVRHTLRQPTESERREYDKAAGKASQVFGSRKRKIRFRTNLKAEVALYDKLIERVDGATVRGQSWDSYTAESKEQLGGFIGIIDPIFKRQAVQALLSSLSASLSD